ncbi:cytochrome P450 [Micromonospora matsumotoense]|uniref:cytochrome P450 n=1 Tax=Micromonospora matsumotoense TaxID=121616 RepID=UPI003D8D440B
MSQESDAAHADCLRVVQASGGTLAWHVGCYELVRSLLGDERLGLAHPLPRLASRLLDSPMVGPLDVTPEQERAQHDLMRQVTQTIASWRGSQRLRHLIQRIVDDHVRRLADAPQPANFHQLIAAPVPRTVVGAILGVSDNDQEHLGTLIERTQDGHDWHRASAAVTQLQDYMLRQLQERARAPREDLLTVLAQTDSSWQATGTPAPPMQNLAALILIAGSITPTSVIDHGLLLLLAHPEQRALLDEEELAPGLIDEIVRVRSFLRSPPKTNPPNGLSRYANTSFQLADAQINVGDLMILDTHTANYDEGQFANPYDFDGGRRRNPHLGFGYGRHRCPGANLARLELELLYRAIFRRLPTLRLAMSPNDLLDEIRRDGGAVRTVPVVWD